METQILKKLTNQKVKDFLFNSCDTDLFVLSKITSDTIKNREILKNLFLAILEQATKEKPFNFHKGTLRYYANNHLLLHTRVFGGGGTPEERFTQQKLASNIAIKGLRDILLFNNIENEIKKQIWVFYEEDPNAFKEFLDHDYSYSIDVGYDCCLFFNERVVIVTKQKREIAEPACMGFAFNFLEKNYIKENEQEITKDLIKSEVKEFEKIGSKLRISVERKVNDNLEILAMGVAIISFSYFAILVFVESTNLWYKIGLSIVLFSVILFSINNIFFNKKYIKVD